METGVAHTGFWCRKRPFGRPRYEWEDNIKWVFRKWVGKEWTGLL